MQSKFMGCIYGSIIGDIIGSYNEFRFGKQIRKLSPKVLQTEKSVFDYPFGYFTDDTSMSLITIKNMSKHYDKSNFMNDWQRWRIKGYMSSDKHCFDIGGQTQRSLIRYFSKIPYIRNKEKVDGNGALMRIHPVALRYYNDELTLYRETSKLNDYTHEESEVSRNLCFNLNWAIAACLQGKSKQEVLNRLMYGPIMDVNVKTSGYVVDTYAAVVHTFNKFDNLMDGVYYLANKGDDSDTCAAIYGALAGAFYGIEQIPSWMLEGIRHKNMIQDIAYKFYDHTISMSGKGAQSI